ncbi:MAG TPA: DUF4340 domain-containing protein [Ohtaekwangia sp.]|uniref:DUF4340 domain-containing protein n=1 Tax=Ohtaekwangia sp. TaxID=2066019 RepID=UPI002F959CFF
MQEKKNKRLLLTLIALLLVTGGIYWYGKRNTSFQVDKDTFHYADLKSVNEIILESPAGKVDLKFMGSAWRVNNTYNADRAMVEVLFATLLKAEPKRPVAISLQDSVGKAVEKNGVKVSLLVGSNVVEQFYAGGNDRKTQAFFRKAGETPYIMTIPGYRVYVSGIFELPENGWRDKYVFGFNWRNFKNLEANFPASPTDNFLVQMDDNFFGVTGIESDTAKLNNYLDAVSLLTVDEYVTTTPELDSLGKTKPVMTLTIRDIGDHEYSLRIFPPIKKQKYFVQSGDAWAVLQENKIRGLLRPKRYFGK